MNNMVCRVARSFSLAASVDVPTDMHNLSVEIFALPIVVDIRSLKAYSH